MNWAFAGASTIAGQYLAGAIRAMGNCEVRWIVSGSDDCAASFARTRGISRSGTDLSAALADPAENAVYISSTNEKHHARALAAIAADTARVEYDQSALCETVVRNVCAVVAGTALPAASGRDGVKSQQIAFAVRDAARSGQRRTVTYGEPR